MRKGLIFLLFITSAACSKQSDGCATDQDCTGNRVCDANARQCVDPPLGPDAGLPDLLVRNDLASPVPDFAGLPITHYATHSIMLPGTMSFAIDIDGGGRPQNQLKSIIGAISAAGFDLQGPVDMAVAAGKTVFLMDVATLDLKDACGSLVVGTASPSPSPPRYDGNDHFTLDPNFAPADLSECAVAGNMSTIVPSKLKPAEVRQIFFALPLGGGILPLTVYGAHVQGRIDGNGILSGQIHGVIRKADIDGMIIPAIAQLLTDSIHADPTGGTSQTIIKLFEDMSNPISQNKCKVAADCCAKSPTTCVILPAEVQANSLIQNVLAPDVQAFSGGVWMPVPKGTQKDSLSVGIGFTAVRENP